LSDALARAEPVYAGTLAIAGLEQPIAIRRDARGVPHVRATAERDAWFGLGFVHAQDRLGQMLWLRRLARGTTAELRGEAGLAVDRLVRTLAIGRSAERAAASLDSTSRADLFAYAAGINARLSRLDPTAVRALLAAPPGAPEEAPWLPADSIAVMKLLSWTMGPSLDAPLVFSDLVEALGSVGARPLLPTGQGIRGIGLDFALPHGKPPVGLPRPADRNRDRDLDLARRQLEGSALKGSAWVVPGAASESGSPLLAVEFQLAASVPAMVYEVHLVADGFDAMGATVPGVPVYWAGRNAHLVWALTPGRVNHFQLYRETLREVGGRREVRHARDWVALETQREVIRVRNFGGEVREEILRLERTPHGPLINRWIAGQTDAISLDWAGTRKGDGLAPLMGLVHAAGAQDLVARLESHHEPVVVVAYADREGEVGWQLAGWVPRRLLASAQLPAPGDQRAFDWEDRLRYASLPRGERNGTTQRWVIASDNALIEGPQNRRIEWSWRHGRRSQRIERALSRLGREGAVNLRGLADMQSRLSARVDSRVVPSLTALLATAAPLSPEAQEIFDLIRDWDGRFAPDRKGAAAYSVFVQDLMRRLLETKLASRLVDRYLALEGLDPSILVEAALLDAATHGRSGGWGDPELLVPLLPESLHRAWVQLSYRRGPNRSRWNWGGLHALVFRPFVGYDPDVKQGVWHFGRDRADPGHAGGLGMADYAATRPFEARTALLYRMVVDLAADDRILTSLAPGQSEHQGQVHFRDGLGPWLEGNPRLIARSPFLVEEQAVDLLRLEPRS